MRAHSADLDHRLLSAERRVRAIKLRVEALIADQISLAASSSRSSPSPSAAASSHSTASSSSSSSSNGSVRRRARSRSPLKPRRLQFATNLQHQPLECVHYRSQSTPTISQSQPHSSHSPAPHLTLQSQIQTNNLTQHVASNTHAPFSPLTPPPAPPPPAPTLPLPAPPPPPPTSQSHARKPLLHHAPAAQPAPKSNTLPSTAPPSKSQPPPPPPPLPSNLVQRVSSSRTPPPPPPSASCTRGTEAIEEQPSSPSPQSRIEKKLDALHAALTTALSLLQSQPAAVSVSSGAPLDTPRPLKKQPPPEHAVKIFDSRQQMLEELKKKVAKRLEAAEEGAIANY